MKTRNSLVSNSSSASFFILWRSLYLDIDNKDRAIDVFKAEVETICECETEAYQLLSQAFDHYNKAVEKSDSCTIALDASGSHNH